jgi:uncharacterized protein (DUF934 family)
MILDREVVDNPFTIVESVGDASLDAQTAVPLADWIAAVDADSSLSLGVIVDPGDSLDAIAERLDRAAFIAVNFPRFTDGRAYSHARRLRKNFGYSGSVVAFGDVLRDQLMHMHRCGINGLILRADQDVEASLDAFQRFAVYYQDDSFPR